MAEDLASSVRDAVSAFVKTRNSTNIPLDVLRIIRDESALLYETQQICDTFDNDPFELCENDDSEIKSQINRAKSLIRVVSCSRVVTKNGYTSIQAEVDFSPDAKMNRTTSQKIQHHLRLSFTFERQPTPQNSVSLMMEQGEETQQADANGGKLPNKLSQTGGTRIFYTIDLSRDFGRKEQLLTVEVMASGEGPSPEPAIPMEEGDDDEWEDFDDKQDDDKSSTDDDDDTTARQKKTDLLSEQTSIQSVAMEEEEGDPTIVINDGKDRFGAYVDPETLQNFLQWSQLELDEMASVYFLMSFPFYEHEWDLVGFLMDSIFGEDQDHDDESMSDGDES